MFTTPVHIAPFAHTIDHRSRVLSVGSCFAANIASKMQRARFNVTNNPCGVLFNPFSIADALERRDFDFFEHDGLWSSFAFHGSLSHTSREDAVRAMETATDLMHADYDWTILTFGTAWAYERQGRVVANCHKMPASEFTRRRLTADEIVSRFDGLLKDKNVILTVSPVRHLKDGLAENTLSKAVLIEAVHELASRHPLTHYFPAFEIMNDELRDYRYYDADMLHPSPVALDYIWRRFSETAFDADTRALTAEVEALATAVEHRPLNPLSAGHARFTESTRLRAEALAARHPYIDLHELLL